MQSMRIGPMDIINKGTHAVGLQPEARTVHNKPVQDMTVYKKKERSGFSGGFKIPEEHKKKKPEKKDAVVEQNQDQQPDQQFVTKEEILAHLNLGFSDSGTHGVGGGKAAITNDIIEGLEKDLKKLKLVEENYKNRLHF